MKDWHYTSFKEIDRDLTILELKRDIAAEELKADFRNLKESLEPRELLSDLVGGDVLKKFLFSWAMGYLLRKIRG
ncbi:DUF6327 family protein [Robiginitalea marina]|uniref:DUF6327 family protein n=1 Tax=Robiginitalea marina TaxID=2954105 RepID=A0ABT1AVX2_9FLAO|nr:DUF6327 family protein [Robiginitalea marina]MCO5724201.1 DUF6327 family protein [Robiginitalea marina]